MARKMVPFVKMIPSKERIMRDQKICQKTPPPAPPFTAGCLFTSSNHDTHSSHREFVQADVLHSRPNNREATGLRGEHVDLISPLPHITEETLNSIGGLNVPMHALRKLVKREGLLFFLSQTSHCLRIALALFGFEGRQLDQCLLFGWLIPDADEFSLDVAPLSPRDGIEDVALLVNQTPLTRCGRKQGRDSGECPCCPSTSGWCFLTLYGLPRKEEYS